MFFNHKRSKTYNFRGVENNVSIVKIYASSLAAKVSCICLFHSSDRTVPMRNITT